MSKVLITGATGFIGNHVTRLCLEQGDEVRVMVMVGEDRSPLAGMDVEYVEGNLLDADSLARAAQGVDKLYHLAALFAVWTKDPDLHYKINVEGTRHMMNAAQAAGIEKIVYTSSIAAIGTDGKGTPSTEDTPFTSWHFASEYIMSKYISHLEVKSRVKDGLPVTMVMPALPFGPGDRMPTPYRYDDYRCAARQNEKLLGRRRMPGRRERCGVRPCIGDGKRARGRVLHPGQLTEQHA